MILEDGDVSQVCPIEIMYLSFDFPFFRYGAHVRGMLVKDDPTNSTLRINVPT